MCTDIVDASLPVCLCVYKIMNTTVRVIIKLYRGIDMVKTLNYIHLESFSTNIDGIIDRDKCFILMAGPFWQMLPSAGQLHNYCIKRHSRADGIMGLLV